MVAPSYLKLSKSEWEERIGKAWKLLNPCQVCPRECKVDRTDRKSKQFGFCRVKDRPIVSSYHPHHGEERCISGHRGSGIIFLTSCNLACVYCQNYEISQLRIGTEISTEQLSEIMVALQTIGCHNINLCSPTSYVPQILKALPIAVEKGLKLPLVYNTNGYDSVEVLKLLNGIIDIYMPDIKYSDDRIARRYSLVPNYWQKVRPAVKEMYRQVGDLVIDKNGLAVGGLLVRHLVLPHGLAGTEKVMNFLAREVSKNTYVNIMNQYYPYHKASQFPELSRRITTEEYSNAVEMAKAAGLWRFDRK